MNQFLMSLPLCLLFFNACEKKEKATSSNPGTTELKTRIIAENLSFPWEIIWGSDNMIWMTERGGKVSRVDPATGVVNTIFTIPDVVSQGEGGLLGMALHPQFSASPQVFVAYNYQNSGNYREKVVRYNYNGSTLVNPQIILDNINAAGIHNGCRLLIVDQKLFISTGDAADQSSPQKTDALNGKILRVNLDGSIPSDNPIAGSPVWSYGHRNAQGLVYANSFLYSSEHGPDSDDEINIIEKGRNFGWPNVKGFCNTGSEQSFCTSFNVKEPMQAWTPTIAACGLDYYNYDLISGWKNSLLLTTLRGSRLIQLKLNESHNAVSATSDYLTDDYGRLRDICISPEGKVYVCTGNGNNDKIIEIAN